MLPAESMAFSSHNAFHRRMPSLGAVSRPLEVHDNVCPLELLCSRIEAASATFSFKTSIRFVHKVFLRRPFSPTLLRSGRKRLSQLSFSDLWGSRRMHRQTDTGELAPPNLSIPKPRVLPRRHLTVTWRDHKLPLSRLSRSMSLRAKPCRFPWTVLGLSSLL